MCRVLKLVTAFVNVNGRDWVFTTSRSATNSTDIYTVQFQYIFSVPIFSAREENSNSNFSSLSDIFSAPQKFIQQLSKISGYPMHNSGSLAFSIFSSDIFSPKYIAENIGIELLYPLLKCISANIPC
jgi:hypothetical protein